MVKVESYDLNFCELLVFTTISSLAGAKMRYFAILIVTFLSFLSIYLGPLY